MFWFVILFAGRGGRVLDYEEQLGDQLGRGGVHEDGQGPGTLRSGDTLRHPGLLPPPGVREMTGGSHQPQISSQVDTMMFLYKYSCHTRTDQTFWSLIGHRSFNQQILSNSIIFIRKY